MKIPVDQVVSNRDPLVRAGCALTFGAVYTHVSGLAASPLLKTTVNVLMSLGNDPHPLVHFYASSTLAQVVNAASLAYMVTAVALLFTETGGAIGSAVGVYL